MKRKFWKPGVAAVTVVAAMVLTFAAIRGATAQAPTPVMRHAASMPAGALAYVEARDLSSLMGMWMASATRERYLASASYRSFRRSRLFLKLSDRLADLERGFGVDISDERLAEIAGGSSALAVYDPGKLEIVLVTEVPSQKALASKLFAQVASFEQRQTAKGMPYYSREVVSDGGSLVQRIAFGYAKDRLWIGTSEALVAEAIDGPAAGGLGTAVAETVQAAANVNQTHDLTVWFDMERSVRNKYFNLYWVQRNAKDFADLRSGLLDIEFAATGVRERRWFVRKAAPAAPPADGRSALSALAAMAPPDAQYVEAKAADAGIAAALAETMFGPDRGSTPLGTVRASSIDSPFDEQDSGNSDARPVGGRYRFLDGRFDRDVDDPALARPKAEAAVAAPVPSLAEQIAPLVAAAQPVGYVVTGSIRLPEGALFASFERSVVVELGAPDRFDSAAFEARARDEFARRFIVGARTTNVSWTDAGGSRALAGALVAQGGAYRVSGKYLIVAANEKQCQAVAARLGAATAAAALPEIAGATTRLAEVRLAEGRAPFRRLTGILDAEASAAIDVEMSDATEDGAEDRRPVLFFSENIASLLDVFQQVSSIRITTAEDGALIRETVEFRLAG